MKGKKRPERPHRRPRVRETKLKRKPDPVLILLLAFGVGVLATLMLPLAANDTAAAPVPELHAGIILEE